VIATLSIIVLCNPAAALLIVLAFRHPLGNRADDRRQFGADRRVLGYLFRRRTRPRHLAAANAPLPQIVALSPNPLFCACRMMACFDPFADIMKNLVHI
jgi:hypothetical protein